MLLFIAEPCDYDRWMGLGDFHRHSRRLAGALALVGVLLYTALVPGHVVSQAAALAHGGEPGLSAEIMCHAGIGVPHDPSAPDKPSKQCPFCKGYASFMTSLAGIGDADVLNAERALPSLIVYDEGRAEYAALRPQNRGPPITL